MTRDFIGFKIVQNDDDKTLIVYRDGFPYIRADLDKSLTPLQLCAYGPMIFDRAKRVIQVIADATPEEVEVMLEDVNWLCGPLTHFSVCSAS